MQWRLIYHNPISQTWMKILNSAEKSIINSKKFEVPLEGETWNHLARSKSEEWVSDSFMPLSPEFNQKKGKKDRFSILLVLKNAEKKAIVI